MKATDAMTGKQPLGSRRKIIEIGNSIGVTLPNDELDSLDVDADQLVELELPATITPQGKFVVDLSQAEREIEMMESIA